MRDASRITTLGALVGLLSPGLVAQTVPNEARELALRTPCVGHVQGADKKPWAKAQIHLVSLLVPQMPDETGCDKARTVSDAEGRFRVRLLRHRNYAIWAVDGERVSKLQFYTAGHPLRLTASKTRAPRQRVEVLGLEKFADLAPFRARLLLHAKHRVPFKLRLDKENRVEIPTLPQEGLELEILDRRGYPLYTQQLRRGTKRIKLYERKQILFVATTPKHQLVSAKISTLHHGQLVPLGKTNAKGTGTVVVAPRFRLGHNYWLHSSEYALSKAIRPRKPGETTFFAEMHPGRVAAGQIFLAPNVPAANARLTLHGQPGRQSLTYTPMYTRTMTTDAQGRFRIEGILIEDEVPDEEERSRINIHLEPRHLAKLPQPWRRMLDPRIDGIWAIPPEVPPKDAGQKIALHEFCPVSFEATLPSGQPAAHTRISILPKVTEYSRRLPDRERFLDATGRLGTLLRPGQAVRVLCDRNSQFASRICIAERVAGDLEPALARIPLPATWTIRGQLESTAGRPLKGFPLSFKTVFGTVTQALPLELESKELPRSAPASRNGVRMSYPDNESFVSQIGLFMQRPKIQTDSKGRFSLELPAIPLRYRVSGSRDILWMKQTVQAKVLINSPIRNLVIQSEKGK